MEEVDSDVKKYVYGKNSPYLSDDASTVIYMPHCEMDIIGNIHTIILGNVYR